MGAHARSPLAWLAIVSLIIVGTACWLNYSAPRAADFVSFWAASQLSGPGAYDVAAHRAVQLSVVVMPGLLPFPYPPPFLLFLAPFGMVDYPSAIVAWVIVTGGIYFLAARRLEWFAHPGVIPSGLNGQTGMLTTGIFIGGFGLLATRPFLAGAILGCMMVKPQLAILFPIALIAGKEWRAIAGGVISSLALLAIALAAFGTGAYQGFLLMATQFSVHLAAGSWPWEKLASTYAFARYFGLASQLAMIVHVVIALGATALVARAWSSGRPHKVAILASATVLIPPYLLSYDCLLLAVPFMALIARPAIAIPLWILAALPVVAFFGIYDGPNTLPLAALASLAGLAYDEFKASNPARPDYRPAPSV